LSTDKEKPMYITPHPINAEQFLLNRSAETDRILRHNRWRPTRTRTRLRRSFGRRSPEA